VSVSRRLFALRLVGRLGYFGAVQLVRRFYSFQKSLLSLSFSFSFSFLSSLLFFTVCFHSLSSSLEMDRNIRPSAVTLRLLVDVHSCSDISVDVEPS
jgi:hypothetical protein